MVSLLSDSFLDPISRRTGNLAFLSWSVCASAATMAAEAVVLLVIEFARPAGLLSEKREAQPMLPGLLARNALPVFLVGNLLTGGVNLATRALEVGTTTTVLLLTAYAAAVSLSAYLLSGTDWRTKILQLTSLSRRRLLQGC